MVQIKNSIIYGGISVLMLSSVAFANSYTNTDTAHMQAMDKITGRVSEIDVPVNGEVKFGSFSIVVRKCVTSAPEDTPENIAFVDIADTYNTQTPINIFKGWMFSSSPALNAVEHPIYDVWLLKCTNSKVKATTLSAEELSARDAIISTQKEEASILVPTTINSDNISIDTPETEATLTTTEAPAKEVISVVVNQSDNNQEGNPQDLLQIEETPNFTIEDEENGFSENDENELTE
ncbi:MAG: DUF2155 domain-containing protein [Alphaproteobacteria bacterium]|nr:DUF2155 domain-containing protein [Alphaproteobacteria bacterium]